MATHGSHWNGGRLGVFHVLGTLVSAGSAVGRTLRARNVQTGRAALVLMPNGRSDWAVREGWDLHLRAETGEGPPRYTLEVDGAPTGGRVADAAEMVGVFRDVLEAADASETLEFSREASEHLTAPPRISPRRALHLVPAPAPAPLPRAARGWFAEVPRPGLSLVAVVLAMVGASVAASVRPGEDVLELAPEAEGDAVLLASLTADVEPPVLIGIAEDAAEEMAAADFSPHIRLVGHGFGRDMPEKPMKGQARPPCDKDPRSGEVEINGACWLGPIEGLKAPCGPKRFDHAGKCYVPVVPAPRERTSVDL